jgi:hypothetical protein
MIRLQLKTIIFVLLLALAIWDLILSTTCLFYPDKWFRIFHDAAYIDPQGLLKRTGAGWVAFTLLQFIAAFRWRKEPWWLVLIAGVRLTEIFTDWVYEYSAASMTTQGKIALFLAPISNILLGLFFIWVYLKIMRERNNATAT